MTVIVAAVAAVIVVWLVSRTSGRWGSQSVTWARDLRQGGTSERGERLDPRRPRDLGVVLLVLLVTVGAVVGVVAASR